MADAVVVISVAPARAALSVRATRDAAPAVAACLATLDLGGDAECVLLGPAEWLIVGPLAREATIYAQIAQALEGLETDVQCVTDAWASWRIEGGDDAVNALLAQGALIHWPTRQLPAASIAWRGALGPFAVLLLRPPEGSVEVWVERAYSEALGTWMRLREGRTAGSSGGGMVSRAVAAPEAGSRAGAAGT